MTYLFLYIVGIILIWWIYRVGWLEALKTVVKVIVPSALIILFNIKAGRLLFKSPVVGLLNITFIGSAELKGLRPLLAFYFEKLKISISSFPVFNKELKKPEEKKMPFFSLVGISTKDNWLCARGRGGGLAIWVKS